MGEQGNLGLPETKKNTGPVECLGQTFESDEARREGGRAEPAAVVGEWRVPAVGTGGADEAPGGGREGSASSEALTAKDGGG